MSEKIISLWVKMANEVHYAPTELKNSNSFLQDCLVKLAKVYICEGVKYAHNLEEDEGCI
jgi:hypothetical protein